VEINKQKIPGVSIEWSVKETKNVTSY
jgi:hypothetical protein